MPFLKQKGQNCKPAKHPQANQLYMNAIMEISRAHAKQCMSVQTTLPVILRQ